MSQGTAFNLRDDASTGTALGLLCVGSGIGDAFSRTQAALNFMEGHLAAALPRAAAAPNPTAEALPGDVRALAATFRFLCERVRPWSRARAS
jgi:hypothetical protein